jgi:hypothetical protein
MPLGGQLVDSIVEWANLKTALWNNIPEAKVDDVIEAIVLQRRFACLLYEIPGRRVRYMLSHPEAPKPLIISRLEKIKNNLNSGRSLASNPEIVDFILSYSSEP